MTNRTLSRALLLASIAIVPLLASGSVAEESKLKCETVKETRCDVTSKGTLYNCRNVTVEKCTVVSGPGSGKAKPAAVVRPPKKKITTKVQSIGQPLTATPAR